MMRPPTAQSPAKWPTAGPPSMRRLAHQIRPSMRGLTPRAGHARKIPPHGIASAAATGEGLLSLRSSSGIAGDYGPAAGPQHYEVAVVPKQADALLLHDPQLVWNRAERAHRGKISRDTMAKLAATDLGRQMKARENPRNRIDRIINNAGLRVGGAQASKAVRV